MWKRIVIGALAAGTLVACGGDDGTNTEATIEQAVSSPSTSVTELRPAEDARAEDALAGEEVAMGQAAEVDGLQVTVTNPVVGGDDLGPWLTVDVRVENPTGVDSSIPYLEIRCASSDEAGGWQAESTLVLGNDLPAGTFDEGTVNLLVPGDGRFGEQRPACVTPAAIAIANSDVRFPLDEATVTALNVGAGEPREVTTAAPTAPPTTIELGDSDVESVMAELVGAGLCSTPRVPAEDPNELDLGIDIKAELECDVRDGVTANVSQLASDDALSALAIVANGFYDAFGIDATQVMVLLPGDAMVVSSEDDDLMAAADWIDEASQVVDGDVVSMAELGGP